MFARDAQALIEDSSAISPLTRSCIAGTTTLKLASTKQDARPVETVYQTFYGNTSQHQAVIVRSDGSATAQYPSEGVAVSVNPEQTGKHRSTWGIAYGEHRALHMGHRRHCIRLAPLHGELDSLCMASLHGKTKRFACQQQSPVCGCIGTPVHITSSYLSIPAHAELHALPPCAPGGAC